MLLKRHSRNLSSLILAQNFPQNTKHENAQLITLNLSFSDGSQTTSDDLPGPLLEVPIDCFDWFKFMFETWCVMLLLPSTNKPAKHG